MTKKYFLAIAPLVFGFSFLLLGWMFFATYAFGLDVTKNDFLLTNSAICTVGGWLSILHFDSQKKDY